MGTPIKLMIGNQPVFLCCPGCEGKAKADPKRTLEKAEELKKAKGRTFMPPSPAPSSSASHEGAQVGANLAKLPPGDRALAEAQRFCPVSGERLGDPSMGVPVKVTINGQLVFLCCNGCEREARKDPQKTLEKVKDLKAGTKPGTHDH
jgi:hypothetical protein